MTSLFKAMEDHPRSRGVYLMTAVQTVVAWGSSPLARGLRPPVWRASRTQRIIPARAGFTRRRYGRIPHGGDHPRSRGVYDPALLKVAPTTGSSPLARGLRPDRPGCDVPPLDHPRSRGVYGKQAWAAITDAGSSPLARGLLVSWFTTYVVPGIIPARAGFTD